jgi:diketogulonate reductase-like aldo/keto reductase
MIEACYPVGHRAAPLILMLALLGPLLDPRKRVELDQIASSWVRRRDGNRMPLLGFGTGGRDDPDLDVNFASMCAAVRAGMRKLDSAAKYKNEHLVGRVVRHCGVPREELWITSKLNVGPRSFGFARESYTFNETVDALHESLRLMNLSYIDMYMIHTPYDLRHRLEQWRALLQLRDQGYIRSVGVANFAIQHLEVLRVAGLEMPTVNQFEFNPWLQQETLFSYCHKHGVAVESYGTLTLKSRWDQVAVKRLSRNYGKTPQQVLLRYAIQRGACPLFTSDNTDHIASNLQLGDFLLSEGEVKALDKLQSENTFEQSTSVWMWESFWDCYGRAHGHECMETEPSASKREQRQTSSE